MALCHGSVLPQLSLVWVVFHFTWIKPQFVIALQKLELRPVNHGFGVQLANNWLLGRIKNNNKITATVASLFGSCERVTSLAHAVTSLPDLSVANSMSYFKWYAVCFAPFLSAYLFLVLSKAQVHQTCLPDTGGGYMVDCVYKCEHSQQ